MINIAWFVVVSLMLAGYAVLDGFDLGVGILHLWLPRGERERATAIDAIGPVWNGNEVWLIAASGSLLAAFPAVYAASFSGFYLALMVVLWLLVFRGLGIEFRHQIHHELWTWAWDVAFSLASVLLAFFYGVAFGNVLRGLPLGDTGQFQGTFSLLLNPFALVGGALSVVALSVHGAAYLAVKTEGPLQARARAVVGPLWWALGAVTIAIVAGSFAVRPDFTRNFVRWPVLALLPLLTVAAIAGILIFQRRADDSRMFASSAATIAGLVGSAAAGLFPRLLPNEYGRSFEGLDIWNAASPEGSLRTALWIYLAGLALVIVYMVHAYRVWGGKVTGEHEYKV